MGKRKHLAHMAISLAASVLFAILIVYSGIVSTLISSTDGLVQVGSFIGGLFFSSVLTTAPSVVILGQLSLESQLFTVAFVGALGAVCGDYLLFSLVKSGVTKDVDYLVSHSGVKRFRALWKTRLFHRILPLLGALMIASPLPDELGLALLGVSKISKERFLLISFCMNFLGIFATGLIARSLAGV